MQLHLPLSTLFLLVTAVLPATYLPLSYTIPATTTECLYERIIAPHEHITSSIFILSGEELRATYIFEGPVAPPIDIIGGVGASQELQKYIATYNKQGMKMFVNGKYGDGMVNVIPIQIQGVVDMEEEVEDYQDDTTEEMRHLEETERHYRLHNKEEVDEEGRRYEQMRHEMEMMKHDHPEMDDYAIAHEERLKQQMEEEAEMDDDFVRLQMDHEAHARRDGGGPPERKRMEDAQRQQQQGRRLQEAGMVPGEPFQKTVTAESPGWYRLCVTARWTTVEVEMELRKSSTYGQIDKHTGHVPGSDMNFTHSEIHSLFDKEDDATVLAEEGAIKTEDLSTTKEQLRILEKVYQEIITKQLEERRVWNWRTVKNQHLYSHLVLGNLVETVVYCLISGYQVYTIRKWFGGNPKLGR
jgi:hypothetical protein